METKRILLVEDDADLRFVYELILKRAGFNLVIAKNGKEALDMLTTHDPHLILLDILMPIMDGREFLKNLAPSQRQNRTIVVCSNTSDETVIDDVKQMGASDVVLKASLDPPGLIALVANYCSLARQ